jgi:hypothetical protein
MRKSKNKSSMEFKEKHTQIVAARIFQDFEKRRNSQEQEPCVARSIVNEHMLQRDRMSQIMGNHKRVHMSLRS